MVDELIKLSSFPGTKSTEFRKIRDPDGTLLTRLQVMLSPNAAANLERITTKTGQTKRQVVETALRELAKALQCNEDR